MNDTDWVDLTDEEIKVKFGMTDEDIANINALYYHVADFYDVLAYFENSYRAFENLKTEVRFPLIKEEKEVENVIRRFNTVRAQFDSSGDGVELLTKIEELK